MHACEQTIKTLRRENARLKRELAKLVKQRVERLQHIEFRAAVKKASDILTPFMPDESCG